MTSNQADQKQFDSKTLPKTLWQLFLLVIRFIPGQFKRYIPRSLTIGGVILVLHSFLLVRLNEGFGPNGATINPFRPNFLMNSAKWLLDSVIGVQGNFIGSIIFYGLLTALITLIFSGFKNFGGFKRFRSMALGRFTRIFSLFKEKNPKRAIVILTGLAIAAFLSYIWRNALVSLMFVFIILRGLVIMQKGGLFHLLAKVIHYDFNRLFKGKGADPNKFSFEDTTLVYQGITLGMTITALPWLESYGLIIGGIALVAILIVKNSGSQPQVATLLLTLVLTSVGLLLISTGLIADDGGWIEAGGNFRGWIQSEGAARAIALGLTAGVGGALGPILVNVLNGLGNGLVGGAGVGGGVSGPGGGGTEYYEDSDWEDYESNDNYDDEEYDEEYEEETEEESEEETEEEEFEYFLSLEGEKGVLKADGRDAIWFFARVYSNDPEVDPAELSSRTQGISFDFYGSGDDWIQVRGQQMSNGYKVIQIRALAPESADPEDHPEVTVSASSHGDTDSVTISLEPAFRSALELSFDGPAAVRPDGEDSTLLVAKIRFYPDNPDLEESVAETIAFEADSNWADMGSGSEGAGQKSTSIKVYPPGGDFDQDRPDTITFTVTAHHDGETLEETIELSLSDLDAWIEIKIDTPTLPVYKQVETYVHAQVMLRVGNDSVLSEELTQTLQLRESGEEGDWLVPSQVGYTGDEAYFTVYAWYPYEDAGVAVPAENSLKIFTDQGDKPLDADVIIKLTPFPETNLVVTTPEETLRPDIDQTVQLRVSVQLNPDDPELDLSDFWETVDIEVEGENNWLVLYEGEMEGDEKVFEIGCENLSEDEDANPPEHLNLLIKGNIFGQEMSETTSIQMEPLPLPEIEVAFERAENTDFPEMGVFPDGEDFTSLIASLSVAEEIEGFDLNEVTQQLTFELAGTAGDWIELSEEVFDAGSGEPVKYLDVYGLLKTANERKNMPQSVEVKVSGELTGRIFDKVVTVQLLDIPEIKLEFQYDRQIESPIPEDKISLTGEDWIEIQAWFELQPRLESVNQQTILETMQFTHLNDSDDWFTFTDETTMETGDGWYGKSVKVAGIPHPDTPANDIPGSREIRIELQYFGEEFSERIPINILGKPTLELDKDEVVLGSGDEKQKVTVKAEIDQTIEEGWEYRLEPEPENADVEIKQEKDNCDFIFTPGTLPEGTEEPNEEIIQVIATKGEFELQQDLKVIVSPIGLFIHSEDPHVITIEDKSVSVAYSVRTVENGEAQLAVKIMQDGMHITNPMEEAEDEGVRNALKQAGFTMVFDGFYGEYGGDTDVARYKFSIDKPLPGEKGKVLSTPVAIKVAEKSEDIYSKEIQLDIQLVDLDDEMNEALEKERCIHMVKAYVPEPHKSDFLEIIERHEALYGPEGYYELRKEIWGWTLDILYKEIQELEDEAAWNEKVVIALEVTSWFGDLAFRLLVSSVTSPMYSGAITMAKGFLVSAIGQYLAGDSVETIVSNMFVGLAIGAPGELIFDPDRLAQKMSFTKACVIYWVYKFIFGVAVQKMSYKESAIRAFAEVAQEVLVKGLGPIVKDHFRSQGYIPASDLMNLDGSFKNPDEIPLGNPVHPEAFGIPVKNAGLLQKIADKFGIELSFRQSNPMCLEHLQNGHPPKPVDIKAKTINYLDVMLGAKEKNVGFVGFFQPEAPTLKPGMSDDLFTKLTKRYHQRMDELTNYSTKMYNLENSGKIKIEDGVVINTGLHGTGQGKAFTGDNDGWAFQGSGGKKLTQAEIQAAEDEMINSGLIEHGAIEYWDPKNDVDLANKSNIINGEGRVIVIGANQSCPTVGSGQMFDMDIKK